MEYSKKAWKYWCDKNGYELVIYDKCKISDLVKYRVTVQRWFDIHDFLEERGVEYSKVLMVDACSIPHWDCPDFFKLTGDNMCGMNDLDNLGWVYESVEGYKHMFDNFNFDITKYMNSGWVIFNKSHKKLFKQFEKYYLENFDEFYKLQTETVKRGTCQTPLNYFIQMNDVKVDFLPQTFRLSHLHRRESLRHNWQMDGSEYEDRTPWFVKYGHIWVFSGFGKEHRNQLMEQTWNMIGHKYE
tara:strand:- start:163 stop:888 length:726 start_codon:yes stop_codon:yes gene_type:complete